MKGKRKWFINIALIVLSLCIMVYGVYSAKNASLTVSGTIGFTAHGVNYTAALTSVTGSYGDAVATTATCDQKTNLLSIPKVVFDDVSQSNATTDTIVPIVLKITVTNASKFKVMLDTESIVTTQKAAKVSSAVNAADSELIEYTATVEYATGLDYMDIDTTTTTANKQCVITITLYMSSSNFDNGVAKDFANDAPYSIPLKLSQVTA